jgi:hypothetical protein
MAALESELCQLLQSALDSCLTHASVATSFTRKELEAVKVSVVYMNYNLWYYQVLLFVICHITT